MEDLAIQNPMEEIGSLTAPVRLLCGPGPLNVHPRVRAALAYPQIGHMDKEFTRICMETQKLLRYLWQTTNELTIPLSGTGTAAWEAGVANLTAKGDVHLVCINGYFGERHCDMAARYGANIRRLDKPWGEAFTMEEIEHAIEQHKPALVWICAAETCTGVLQKMDGIGAACTRNNALLMVDAVTLLGGQPFSLDRQQVDCSYAAAQKCLGCPSGISAITFGPRAVQKMNDMRQNGHKVANWYLDMELLEKYWVPSNDLPRVYHHTLSSPMMLGLREALSLIASETLERTWARHLDVARYFWKSIANLGLKMFVSSPELRCTSLHTVVVPPGFDALKVIQFMKATHNVEIGGGLGKPMVGKVWRIGLMGYNCTRQVAMTVVQALKEALEDQGWTA